ncbi:pyridoxal-phosphate dependent enzyme family protein [hydrothermal vent metagenome]|uniref:Pyridoxal-phosphate dependent enzyme family protein n=2 Tax=hydrothermal vent metagenome TaxID=652676 RepID=A0A3B0URY1_9ZZZZ
MRNQPIPTLHDIIAARPNVYRFLKPTPLYYYATLSQLIGAEVWIKHENHQPIGAFKVRGGLNMAANLSKAEKEAGLFTASTGNHGQSIAFAARAFGIKATIAVPDGANPSKVAAMRGMGAEVVFHGPDFDTAREWIMGVAEEKNGRFVSPTEELLIHGVGTYALEILEDLPDVDTIIVPVGAGSGACGVSIVAKSINPNIEVIAAQSAQAPAMQRSWQAGEMIMADMNTFAEGVATRVPFSNTQRIMRRYLDDFLLVDDADIKEAIRLLLQHTHNLAEGAGAVSLAAAMQEKERLAGKKVVLVMSGGNLSLERLKEIL